MKTAQKWNSLKSCPRPFGPYLGAPSDMFEDFSEKMVGRMNSEIFSELRGNFVLMAGCISAMSPRRRRLRAFCQKTRRSTVSLNQSVGLSAGEANVLIQWRLGISNWRVRKER